MGDNLKRVPVVVIEGALKYRLMDDLKGDIVDLYPEIGDTIQLPLGIAKIERKSGNVRALLPEEKARWKKKFTKKKKKKA